MHQLKFFIHKACDSRQIGRPRFLDRGLHLDFEALEWSKLVEIWGTQMRQKYNPQLNVWTSLADSHGSSQATTARDMEARS